MKKAILVILFVTAIQAKAEVFVQSVARDSVIRVPLRIEMYDGDRTQDFLALARKVSWNEDTTGDYPPNWSNVREAQVEIDRKRDQDFSIISGIDSITGKMELFIDYALERRFDKDSIIVIDPGNSEHIAWFRNDGRVLTVGTSPESLPLKLNLDARGNLSYNFPVIAVGEFEWGGRIYEINTMSGHTTNFAFTNNTFLIRDKTAGDFGPLMRDIINIAEDFFYVENVDIEKGFLELRLDPAKGIPIKPLVGFRAPSFNETAIYPEPVNIHSDAYSGRYVLINFWATWCAPCLTHMAELQGISAKLEESNVTIISINIGEKEKMERVMEVIQKYGSGWTHLMSEELSDAFHVINLPTSFLIDPDGIILSMDESVPELSNRFKLE